MLLTFLLFTTLLQHDETFRKCLEQSPSGWTKSDSIRTFRGEALYDLIDGGADVFHEYGFRQVATCSFSSDSLHKISVEVYEMEDEESAYGIFSMFASDGSYALNVGDSAVGGEYFLFIRRGHHFISLTSSEEIPTNDIGIMRLAREITQSLPEGGEKPALVRSLHEVSLNPAIYIQGPLVFASRSNFPIAKVPPFTDGIVAKGAGANLAILRFNSGDEATAAERILASQLHERGFGDLSSDGDNVILRNAEGRLILLSTLQNSVVLLDGRDSNQLANRVAQLRTAFPAPGK